MSLLGANHDQHLDIHDNDRQAWNALISSFLEQNDNIKSNDYSVETNPDEIILSTTNATISLAIKEVLSSPAITRQKLCYSLKEIYDTSSLSSKILSSPSVNINDVSALTISYIF